MAAPSVFTTRPALTTPFQPDASYSLPNLLSEPDNPYTNGHWSQSTIIRILLGLLIAAGVTLMLIRATECILLWFIPMEGYWYSVSGFIVWQSLEMVGVFVGTMMAGAGRNQMMTLGILIGISVGFLTLLIFPTNPNISTALYFGMPGWFTIAGAFGAWLGESIWHPQYRKSMRTLSAGSLTKDQHDLSLTQLVRQAVIGMIFANIRWLRVVLAVVIILPALWLTQDLVDAIIMKFNLLLWVREVGLQKAWLVTMLKIIVIVLCGVMVGAATNHGIAHGFWTGVITGVLNLLLHVFIPKEEMPVNSVLWEVAWVFGLCVMTGGFGALIIPPMMYLAQKRRPASLR